MVRGIRLSHSVFMVQVLPLDAALDKLFAWVPPKKTDQLIALSREILKAFDAANGGVHSGFRAAHAKGIVLSGTFTPAPGGAALTRAPHVQRPSTPVMVRFSDFAGIPTVADNNPNASPRGFAIRFQLGGDATTDIVGHSIEAFPGRTRKT